MECPDCSSTYIVKRGRRKVRYGTRQLYHCNSCGRDFVGEGMRHKTYPPNVVIDALKTYLTGATLKEASNRVNSRFKVNTSKSTIHSWVDEYAEVCRYRYLRDAHRKRYGSLDIERHVFEHHGLEYAFAYHPAKLEELWNQFPSVAEFIEEIPGECRDRLFDRGDRSSQVSFAVDADVYATRNSACELAELALTAVDNRNRRHEAVQDFMLKCDAATVAVELPVWWYHKGRETTLTGHIDLVQHRGGKVFILDYKPKAESKQPMDQLWSYARGMSYRTETPLQKFRAAWFNEDVYREFAPGAAEVSA